MAFSSFGNSGGTNTNAGGAGGSTVMGPALQEIEVDGLSFLAIQGEAKVRLLPTPWPENNLPAPTSSLLSIASRKGLIAAVGPDVIVLAKTESARKAFDTDNKVDETNIRPFQPELSIPMPMRVSQLAFTGDEEYLVASAEAGGGLAVYSVTSLLQGSTQSAFEMGTNGLSLRALVPNPTPEKGELLALVTSDGKLMMANLKERVFVPGPNGQVLKDDVSCVSWSAKGKQLVAGLGNGGASQMTPNGVVQAEIPLPPSISNHHMTAISWIDNNVFLVTHTSSPSENPESQFHIVQRQDKTSNFEFSKVSDPAGPFGMQRFPPHYFILRLRGFLNLQDVLVVTSTAAVDVGIFTRSQAPLAPGAPTGVFTLTEFLDDSRRAAVPSNESWAVTSPIGFALDLSSKDIVREPIKGDEVDSKTPLPIVMLLNNEGLLAAWYFVYNESIRQGAIYPGLTAAPAIAPQASPAPPQQPAPSAFSAQSGTAFGATSGIGQRTSPWTTPSATNAGAPAFGTPAFRSTTAPANPAFGSPAFGSATTPASSVFGAPSQPAFGSSGFATQKASVWGSATSAAAPTAAFGQPSGIGQSASVFGSKASSSGNAAPASGGFSSFASNSNPFASATSGSKESIFTAKPQAANPFSSTTTSTINTFGNSSNKADDKPSTFGSGGGFVLESSFKDNTSPPNESSTSSGPSLFGNTFGNALAEADETEQPASNDADMDATDDQPSQPEVVKSADSTTPESTPAPPSKFSAFGTSAPSTSGLFGTASSTTPASKPFAAPSFSFGQASGQPAGDVKSSSASKAPSIFETPSTPSTSTPASKQSTFGHLGPNSTPAVNPFAKPPVTPQVPATPLPKISQTPATPVTKIKDEPKHDADESGVGKSIPEAPLPPDTTSKDAFTAGDTSGSSTATDAPLPPDFLPSKPKPAISADIIPPSDVPGGPGDDGGNDSGFDTSEAGDQSADEDEEGSGEDVAQDLSPVSEENKTQSSFNLSPESTFEKIEKPTQPTVPRSLFGEIGRSAPILPPPNLQTSPRSPSPIRSAIPRRLTRPDASRSVSAPGMASQILGSQKPVTAVPNQGTFPFGAQKGPLAAQAPSRPTIEEQNAAERRRAHSKARKEAEEAQNIIYEQEQKRLEYISHELEPTTTLGEFEAHVGTLDLDRDGREKSKSVPAQVETIYRDINSMIDTLGLNARTLKCFVKGHTELGKDGFRSKEELEDPDDWCLVEVEELSSVVENDLSRELANGSLKEVSRKLEVCDDLQKDLARLQAKKEDLRKILQLRQDPNQATLSRQQPLSAEQAAQQQDLLKEFTTFQTLLAEAEEGLINLKTKIVSHSSSKNGTARPTVEAVMRTITKMTSMAEKRSGDIDVLEGKMRKLRFGSITSDSREGSPQPYATPQSNRASLRGPNASTYGLFYTPDSTRDDRHGLQNSFMSSTGSFSRGSPGPRKKLSGYSLEEKAQLRANLAKKNDVKIRLRAALEKAGTTVRPMDDE